MTFLKLRFSRFVRLVLGLVVIAVVAVGGIVYSARTAGANGYGCLMVLHDNRPDRLLDLNTGSMTRYRHPVGQQPRLVLSSVSPDGRYRAYLQPVTPSRYNLLVEETASRKVTLVQDNAAITPTAGNYTSYFLWAPDSSRFAYLWASSTLQSSYVVIARPDGGDKRRIDGATSIGGWSRDSVYLAFTTGTNNPVLNLWSASSLTTRSLQANRWFNAVWSPSGNRLAYLETPANASATSVWLTIVSPDQAPGISFPLPPVRSASEVGTPLWSPDGRYVALTYYDQVGDRRLDLYGIDGSAVSGIAANMLPDWWRLWSADGKSLTYFERQPDGTLDWLAYRVDAGRYDTILSGVIGSPDGSQRVVLKWRQNGKLNVALMNGDGSQRSTLVQGADVVDYVNWSPDWSAVVVLWSVGQGSAREEHLTWATIDLQDTLVDKVDSIRNLTWLDGGKALAFITERLNRFSAELLDLKNGIRHGLLDKKRAITSVPWTASANQVAYHWIAADATDWIDAFGPDGRLLYEFQAGDSVFSRLYPAPGGRVAAMKVILQPGSAWGNGLMVASADGQPPRVIRDGIIEVDNVYWSPDSKALAFTQIGQNGVWTLEVMTVEGRTVQSFIGDLALPTRDERMMWTGCG
jgi:hypothetical protein